MKFKRRIGSTSMASLLRQVRAPTHPSLYIPAPSLFIAVSFVRFYVLTKVQGHRTFWFQTTTRLVFLMSLREIKSTRVTSTMYTNAKFDTRANKERERKKENDVRMRKWHISKVSFII